MSDYQIETRRRSRSKTPFLRSACDHENCDMAGEEGHTHHHHHHKKKTAAAPNVNTIVEEASEATTSSEAKRQTRAKTSDYSSEENSPEGQRNTRQNSARASKATTTTTTTTTTIIKKKAISDEGVGATSTPKANNSLLSSFAARFTGSVGRAKEIVQNESNTELERSLKDASNTSASLNNSHNQSGFFRRLLNSTYNSNSNNSPANFTGQLSANSEHLAYQVYKEAGEYWNKTKKTDYTYSELSRDRTYLAPGVVAMPNMSRRGLYSHGERVQVMIQQNPAEEEFIRRRYDYKTYAERRQETERLLYDSGDEVDNSLRGYTRKRQFYNSEDASWLVRVITTIVTSWTTAWQTVTGGGAKSGVGLQRSPLYGTRYAAEERGFFGSIAHGISSVFLALLRYVYLFIGYVLCLDTWLLQSSNVDNKNRKRFLLLLLILLPLLLLAGLFYYLNPNEPFPPRSFSELTLSLPALPAIPKFNVSEFVNQEKYEIFKSQAYDQFEAVRDWTDDYFLYLKTMSQNVVDEARKVFQRQEHFERA